MKILLGDFNAKLGREDVFKLIFGNESLHQDRKDNGVTVVSFATSKYMGTAVAQWLRCCATNRKVAGSIPAGVIEFFIDIKSFRSHYGHGVDSASNRNE